MKTRKCTKCEKRFPETVDYFYRNKTKRDGLQFQCKECMKKYYLEHQEELKARNKKYEVKRRGRKKEYNIEYYKTIQGYLRNVYKNMKYRCGFSNGCYLNIENKFISADEFVDYVINELQVDPRGLDIHRIDNDGNYGPGNIEFLTEFQHQEKHRIININKELLVLY